MDKDSSCNPHRHTKERSRTTSSLPSCSHYYTQPLPESSKLPWNKLTSQLGHQHFLPQKLPLHCPRKPQNVFLFHCSHDSGLVISRCVGKKTALRSNSAPPSQQQTLNKLPTELRGRNFVSKHRLSMQSRRRTCKKKTRVRNVCVFRLSFHFACHRWWLGVHEFYCTCLNQQPQQVMEW